MAAALPAPKWRPHAVRGSREEPRSASNIRLIPAERSPTVLAPPTPRKVQGPRYGSPLLRHRQARSQGGDTMRERATVTSIHPLPSQALGTRPTRLLRSSKSKSVTPLARALCWWSACQDTSAGSAHVRAALATTFTIHRRLSQPTMNDPTT
ncbi:hypothetical protein B0H10DRAFT_1962582 [Mycena sp. CBHHK59/15]|nr:hypothetical protein B0H10DRAFT_1962582 [Mycena sp. CBHHK59/15]